MSIQRILLVDIELDRTTTEQGMEYQVAGNTHHPLGLMYLASSTNQVFPNIEIKILHTATCYDSEKELVDLLESFQPHLVGIRCLSLFQSQFKYLAKARRLVAGPEISAPMEQISGRTTRKLLTERERASSSLATSPHQGATSRQ